MAAELDPRGRHRAGTTVAAAARPLSKSQRTAPNLPARRTGRNPEPSKNQGRARAGRFAVPPVCETK